jgi:hypothetical protein
MAISKEKLDQIRRFHEGWLHKEYPFVSAGQLEDSSTVISLLNEIDALRDIVTELEEVKWKYEDLCK